jgi:molybdopterin-containing oxidoreductase family iron-sulfur binding subunit
LTHKGLGGYKTRHIIKETTLDEYKKDNASENVIGEHKRKDWIKDELVTLYPGHTYPGHHWKMVIDLNSCIGCAACVVACTAENNVSVVGRDQVIKAREMHWLRIDKYYTGDDNNPQVTFQPMMCQHCDNAPCENVCPVAATNHSTEGINQMAYNRCIGTRYCANNCPYKVRRFNWYDYADADSFDKKYYTENIENIAEFPQVGMNEPLTRMILNPDVTVRSRGVIEKCSMCAQRLQAGKLEAKKAGEPLKDGAIRTACQNACPTNAIQFGDYNNKESLVSNLIDKDERVFGVIEEIHTLPNVMYMTKVRNKAKIDEFSFPENLLFS